MVEIGEYYFEAGQKLFLNLGFELTSYSLAYQLSLSEPDVLAYKKSLITCTSPNYVKQSEIAI